MAVMVVMVCIAMLRGKNGEESNKISVIIQNSNDSQWAAFKYGLRMAAQDQGTEMFVVNTGTAMSAEEEQEAIEREIENGADAVIIQPVLTGDMENVLKKAAKRLPIMLVESPEAGDFEEFGIAAVQPDNYALGRVLAEELLNDYNGKLEGKAIGIVSEFKDSKALERQEGLNSVLKEQGIEVNWVASGISPEEEEFILGMKSKVDFVVALDDYSLVTAGKAALAHNLHGALVYGIGNSMDAVYCLDTGCVQCLVVPDDFSMGYQSLTGLAESLGRILRKPKSQTVSYTVMRKDTLFTGENQKILFTMSQ